MGNSAKHELMCFTIRYVADVVRGYSVNIGIILIGMGADTGFAQVRFTREWRDVLRADPGADIELLQALERDISERLADGGNRDEILYRLQDLCSSAIQIHSEAIYSGLEPALEMDRLMEIYVDPQPLPGAIRIPSVRQRLYASMRDCFQREGVWDLMLKDIAASTYTRKGDPLKIDCGYRVKDVIKLFHAVALSSDVNSAKSLAFSYPGLVAGISQAEKADATLTAVVEDHLDENDESIAFALATMQGVGIAVSPAEDLPSLALQARLEWGQ